MLSIRNCVWGILTILCCHNNSISQTRLEKIYLSQVGMREQPAGSNWGPQVGKYLRSVNVKMPAAWCAAFVHYCLDSAGIKNNITAWSPTAHNAKYVVYFGRRLIEEPKPGDVFTLYFPKMKRIAHTGFYHRRVNSSVYQSVEGNTNEAGSREGDGVYKKYRSYNATYSITRHGN